MNCARCGRNNPDSSRFCESCGAELRAAQPIGGAIQRNEPVRPGAPPAAPYTYANNPPPPGGYVPAAPPTYVAAQSADTRPLSVGGFLLTMIVMAIPLIGFIMLLVWAFGSGNVNRRNYARAALILSLIAIGLVIVLSLVMGSLMASIIDGFSRNGFPAFTR